GRYGRCRSATFHRLASPPAWAPDFYRDAARTGGALVDLHIHDADFVRFAFGHPRRVKSTGSIDHVTTLYEYDDVDHVVAEGGWDHAPGHPFQMRYLVNFEDATADFDVARETPLLVHRNGESEAIDLPPHTGYDAEVLACMTAIRDGAPSPVPVADAVAVLELLEAERASFSE
ncbi:MAG: gfo/Idh/MocA family oxidoreductase, partial [Phycisphaerales bacterium]|nr:gfo/Idh/MocA family oxidoreductase [Phycisphaerales bacterium]